MEDRSLQQAKDGVAQIAKLLQCPICCDWLRTPVNFSICSHTYCSVCIRRALGFKSECPMCKEEVRESDLRPNRLAEDLATRYSALMPRLQTILNSPPSLVIQSPRKPPPKRIEPSPEIRNRPIINASPEYTNGLPEPSQKHAPPSLMSLSALTQVPKKVSVVRFDDEEEEEEDSAEPAIQEQKPSSPRLPVASEPKSSHPPDGKVKCPVCELYIAANSVNNHLDVCLARPESRENFYRQHKSEVKKPSSSLKPPAKLVYRLLSDKQLKQLLKDAGLSTKGKRDDLVRRHKEYVLQMTVRCDEVNPRSSAEIVREIEANEKKNAPASVKAVKTEVRVTDPEFDRLIAQVKTRKKSTTVEKTSTPTHDEGTQKPQSNNVILIEDSNSGGSVVFDLGTPPSDKIAGEKESQLPLTGAAVSQLHSTQQPLIDSSPFIMPATLAHLTPQRITRTSSMMQLKRHAAVHKEESTPPKKRTDNATPDKKSSPRSQKKNRLK